MSKYWLGQLRHAYKNAVGGHIGDQEAFANNLLHPAIADAEKYVTATDEELAKLKEEVERLKSVKVAAAKLYKVLEGTMAAQGPSGLALKKALGEE